MRHNLFFILFFVSIGIFTLPKANHAQELASAQNYQTTFLSQPQDIPLMQGLHEIDEEALNFDTPAGRIIKTTAFSDSLTTEQIQNFYQKTLPQFGWIQQSPSVFTRSGEKIRLSFQAQDTLTLITFYVEPI